MGNQPKAVIFPKSTQSPPLRSPVTLITKARAVGGRGSAARKRSATRVPPGSQSPKVTDSDAEDQPAQPASFGSKKTSEGKLHYNLTNSTEL